MDLLLCGILTALEVQYLPQLRSLHIGGLGACTVFLVQYLSLKFYRLYLYPKHLSPLRKLPGPKNDTPLIGQAYNMYKSPPMELYISWMKQWPDSPLIRFLDLANQEVVMLNSVKATKDVLQTNCYTFVKPAFLRRVLGEITGVGLLFSEGESHKRQRKILTGAFNYQRVKDMLPFFLSKADELCSALDKLVDGNSDQPIEMTAILAKTTLDAIGLAALGAEFNNIDQLSEFSLAFEDVFTQARSTVSILMSVLNAYMPIRKLLPIKVNRDYLGANAKIRSLLVQQIRKRQQEMAATEKSSQKGKDLLSILIHDGVEGRQPWTEDEMVGHLLNFMAAGHETTAGLLTLTLYTLATNPDSQTRLRNEILEAIPSDEALNFNSVESLSYLSKVGKEVLRLYPPALVSHREASKDVVIEGVTLPKGTVVHIVPAAIHYNSLIWGPDADKYDPDRWDHVPKTASDPYAAGSFLNGPRICIGKSFGLLEYKVYLIQLLKNFELTYEGQPLQFQRGGPSLRPQGGLWLKIKPLKRE